MTIKKYSKIHFGPGPHWETVEGNEDWFCIDGDSSRATNQTGVIEFSNFKKLPFESNTCEAIYSSHTFEHINPHVFYNVLRECHRVMRSGAYIRIVIPDPVKSIKAYLSGDKNDLFKRRAEKHRRLYGWDPTLFELMREDFVSMAGQTEMLGKDGLAHQNSWDKETMYACLNRVGFDSENIYSVNFKESRTDLFKFEGSYPSEANEHMRSQYFEAMK